VHGNKYNICKCYNLGAPEPIKLTNTILYALSCKMKPIEAVMMIWMDNITILLGRFKKMGAFNTQ